MPGIHKWKTLSFRPSESERQLIEARAKVSGMHKKDFIAKSCIYSSVCVVGNKKHIESLVLAVQDLRFTLNDIASGMTTGNFAVPSDDFVTMRMEYMSLVSSLMEIIDASAYLFNAVVPQKSEVDKQKAQVMDMLNAIYSESEKTCHQEAQVPKTCQ